METIERLREEIRVVFGEWEKLPRIPSHWKIAGVQDTRQDRYTLQEIDFAKNQYDTRLLVYLEIRDGKIWILTDNTEEGIATQLVSQGIPKQQIVLGFYPPTVRQIGEFAVA